MQRFPGVISPTPPMDMDTPHFEDEETEVTKNGGVGRRERVGHSRVRAAASRGRQALALDHVHAQLRGARLVAQREVHRAAHLHGSRLRLPGQAQLAAAQLRARVQVKESVQAGLRSPQGRGGARGGEGGVRPGPRAELRREGAPLPTGLPRPQVLALTPHRGGVEAGHGGAAAEHAVE